MLTDMINIQYNFFLFVTIKETYYFSSIKQHYKKYIVLNVLNEKDNTVIQWQRDAGIAGIGMRDAVFTHAGPSSSV